MFPPFNFRFGQEDNLQSKFFRNFNENSFGPVESNPYDFAADSGPSNPQSTSTQQPGFMDVYRELMNRQNGPAMSAYRKYVEKPTPTGNDFKVSKVSRLAAILSGMSAGFRDPGKGVEVAQSIIDRPYQEGMRRYNNEGNRLREAANLEETDSKNKIGAVKSVMDIRDKEEDNIRQAKLADSTIATNAARAKAAGNKVIHADDGHVYVFDANNQKTDLGKLGATPDEKVKRAIDQAVGIAKGEAPIKVDTAIKTAEGTSPIIEGREKRVGAANSANVEGRDKRLLDIKFNQEKDLETNIRQPNRIAIEQERQKGREAITKSKLDAAQKRIDSRINVAKDPSITQKIKTNVMKAQALVDADPSLEDYWEPDNSKDPLKAPPSDHNSPEYAAWNKLYNTLYEGINSSPVKVTTSGNRIIR